MIKPLVAGNWKMNGSRTIADSLTREILQKTEMLSAQTDIAIFPPSVYLSTVAQAATDSNLSFGLQNIATEKSGAFTGEISACMAQDMGCEYALAGHSERRKFYGENDDQITQKCNLITQMKMTAILCVGETLEERSQDLTQQVIKRQVMNVVSSLTEAQLRYLVIAYEPVWAIGTGKTATPEHAQSVHADIRSTVATKHPNVASDLRILYGGSVKPENAQMLFAQPDINGGLIGGASLEADSFVAICQAAG